MPTNTLPQLHDVVLSATTGLRYEVVFRYRDPSTSQVIALHVERVGGIVGRRMELDEVAEIVSTTKG